MRCVACNHSQNDSTPVTSELCGYCIGSIEYWEVVDRKEKRQWQKEHPAGLATAGKGTAAGATSAIMFAGRERQVSS